jgi:uncharacterized protein YndB with AHSA1/START domain
MGAGQVVLGTLDATQDGRFAMRFTRTYASPRDKVWRALTETDLLSTWFDQMIDYDNSRLDFTELASLYFIAKDEHLFPAQHGRVTRVDPPCVLEYTRGSEVLRWQLAAFGNSASRLVLTVVVDMRGSAIANAPHLHAALDRLHTTLTGRRSATADLNELQRAYDRALG